MNMNGMILYPTDDETKELIRVSIFGNTTWSEEVSWIGLILAWIWYKIKCRKPLKINETVLG